MWRESNPRSWSFPASCSDYWSFTSFVVRAGIEPALILSSSAHTITMRGSCALFQSLPVAPFTGFPYLPFFAKLVGYLPKESLLSSGRMTMFFPKNNYILFVHRATLHEATHIKPIYDSLKTHTHTRVGMCVAVCPHTPTRPPLRVEGYGAQCPHGGLGNGGLIYIYILPSFGEWFLAVQMIDCCLLIFRL